MMDDTKIGGVCPTRKGFFSVINAEEAKKRADNSSKILVESELKEVYDEVYEAAGRGQYEVNINKILTKEALKRLTELGYKYDPIGENRMDEGFKQYGYKITWK